MAKSQEALDKKADNARELGLNYEPPQRQWVGLTDEEYAKLAEEFGPFPINQIEAKLKEKNT